MLKRNTSGLQEHAQQKRESAFERTDKAIQKLLKEKKNINFGTVSEEAGVSRTWLYNQTDIRDRIEELRNNQTAKKSKINKSASVKRIVINSSKSSELIELQQRIKKLETENLVLRQHLEVVYGLSDTELVRTVEVLQVENGELKRQLQEIISSNDTTVCSESIVHQFYERIATLESERKALVIQHEQVTQQLGQLQQEQRESVNLKAKNHSVAEEIKLLLLELESTRQELKELKQRQSEKLTQELQESRNSQLTSNIPIIESKVTSLDKKRSKRNEISDQIKSRLDELGIPLNTTLTKTIKSAASIDIVLTAIEALSYALKHGNIENSGGWLNTAIKDGWMPNEKHLPNQKNERNIFKKWFDLAYKQRLVLAATKGDDGQMYVYTKDGLPVLFTQILTEYPLEKLK